LYELIQSENTIVQFISLLIMITNTFIVWNLSVERIFKNEDENSMLYMFTIGVGIINRVISVGLRLYL
jgi:NADH:ubiquinone oxidoreductase subunit K